MEAKIINKNEFQQDSFVTTNKADGIDVVLGKLNSGNDLIVQSYLFDDNKFNESSVKEWLSNNKIKYILLNAAKPKKYNTDLPEFIQSTYVNRMINELESFEENQIEMSWSSYGGSVWAGMQFADYMKNTNKEITARVTGIAASMGASLLPYFKKVIGAKQTDVMLHSTSTSVSQLARKSNQELYDILKTKINEEKFEEITGQKLKTIMFLEGEERKDVWLSGEQAYKIGLFDELIDLTPEKKNEINLQLVAELDYKLPERLLNTNKKEKQMNIDELKTSHPELYAQVLEDGKKVGSKEATAALKAEKDRINTWMVFNDIDPEKVKKGIESGEAMTEAQRTEFLRKSQVLDLKNDLENDSPEDLTPDPNTGKVKTEEQRKEEKENKKVNAAFDELGIKDEEDK